MVKDIEPIDCVSLEVADFIKWCVISHKEGSVGWDTNNPITLDEACHATQLMISSDVYYDGGSTDREIVWDIILVKRGKLSIDDALYPILVKAALSKDLKFSKLMNFL